MPRKQREPDTVFEPVEVPFVPTADHRRAEDWNNEPTELPWQQPRCRNCNNFMWTRQPERHDICEECGYILRDQMQMNETVKTRQRTDVILNPFAGGPFSGQTGSLPDNPAAQPFAKPEWK